MNITSLMKQVRMVKSRRHLRLVRGKFEKAIRGLSIPLQDSAMREFSRLVKASHDYLPY